MSSQTHDCVACDGRLTIETESEWGRCGHCGTKYGPPWDSPEVLSSPLDVDAEASAQVAEQRDEADAAVPIGDGVTLEVHVHVHRE